MCELLGLAFNRAITPGLSFRGFRHRAERNDDGWGLAAITPTSATIVKEPRPADRSVKAAALRDNPTLTAPIFIGHVRLASCGDVNLDNTHPFTRRVRGRDFVFAHNGTLTKATLMAHASAEFPVSGSTDSELAMCALLSRMTRDDVGDRDFARLEEILRDLNGAGRMNLLFSDGTRLFCYRDTAGYNGLCATHRRAPFSHVRLRDEHWEADLPEEKSPHQRGFVIASHPLTTGEPWSDFAPGSLTVFERGKIVFGACG